ncbi:MAG: hypothetical protein IVW52_19535 [Acidimicrobiales bacterium]|nr:hypothetical protein [Acidimicrobiales bacterium]
MTATTNDDTARRDSALTPSTIRAVIGLTVAVAVVAATGILGATPAGASTTGLAQRVIALAQPGTAHAAYVPGAPRVPGPPNISKVTTASGSASVVTPQVSTTATGISATYTGTTLVVHWDSGNSLTVSGAGPLAAGSTVASLLGQGGSVTVVAGGQTCGPNGFVGGVSIDQFTHDGTGTVTAMALQFFCVTASLGFAALGTVGLNVPPSTRPPGYNLYQSGGSVSSSATLSSSASLFGSIFGVDLFGDLSGTTLNQPVVGMATTPLDGGYWLVAGDGGVFSFGDASFYGSTGSLHLNKPVLGMAATPDAKGYWFVASDGGIFSYGDAAFYGSTGSLHLNKPIVGMAATPDGKGYWLVASDGGIFSFGDAAFYGSTGSLHLNQPIVGMAPTPSGNGYWLVAADGGIFSFGDAGFHGSAGSIHLNSPIVGMAASPSGNGYWITAADGGVFSYDDAPFNGSLGGTGVTDVAGIAR